MKSNIETNSTSFMTEFKELLKKYNVDIYIDLDGDTHCVISSIVIEVDRKEVGRFYDNLDTLIYEV